MVKGQIDQARGDPQGVFLVFRNGRRPDADKIEKLVKQLPTVSVSFNPAKAQHLRLVASDGSRTTSGEDSPGNWLEILSDGLTFDLVGLAPGQAVPFPDCESKFDFERGISDRCEHAINLRPGEHISSAAGSAPVLKGLLRLTRDFVHHFEEIDAIVWPHSESVIGRRFFESTVTAYLEGGAFPALGLVSFRQTVDGGLQSVGLSHMTQQEIRIEPDLATDKVAATRLAVRLINQLVLTGTIQRAEEVVAPDGRILRLEPSANERFVRVWSG
ncbi:hypothetical protein BPTFM16_01038 [Altererythrobacter insulae]|nr:hypothetical protein BPTFM16_01038 [Altererythrobacter insulae]